MSTECEGPEHQEPPTELIEKPVEGGLSTWKREPQRVVCNFDGDDRQRFLMQMRCLAASSGGDAVLGKPIRVRYWMIHEVDFLSDDGSEKVRTYRTVLVTPEGDTYAFVSGGVANGVRHIFNQFGTAPLDPPLVVRIEQKTTSNKRRVYVMIPETEPVKASGRK